MFRMRQLISKMTGKPANRKPFTEITNEQQGIGLELLDQLPIDVTPGSMEISCDGKTKMRQN